MPLPAVLPDHLPPRRLTHKQAAFVREYLVDLNATQAAIRAGYSEKTSNVIGSQNLAKVSIQVALSTALEERARRCHVTQDRVIYELARIAFANMADYITIQPDGSPIVNLSTLSADQAAAIQEVVSEVYMEGSGEDAVPVKRVKVKLHARTAALQLLGKHLGMFGDRLKVTAEVEVRHTITLKDLPIEAKLQIAKGLQEAGVDLPGVRPIGEIPEPVEMIDVTPRKPAK